MVTKPGAIGLDRADRRPSGGRPNRQQSGGLTTDNVKGYLGPLPDAISTTLNSATWQSAHIPTAGLTLSLGIHAMAVTFGDDDRTYVPTDPPGFSSTGPQPVPTVVGDENATPVSGQGGSTLYYPGGLNLTSSRWRCRSSTSAPSRERTHWFASSRSRLATATSAGSSCLGVGAQHSISQLLQGPAGRRGAGWPVPADEARRRRSRGRQHVSRRGHGEQELRRGCSRMRASGSTASA